MKKLILMAGFLTLVGCTPDESVFKSTVPLTAPVLPKVQEVLPSAVNLKMPFFPQAPDGDWGLPWQEACEESSAVLTYYAKKNLRPTKDQFRAKILEIVDWETKRFGDYKHTTIEQTAMILREFLGYSNVDIIENPTADQMKEILAAGNFIVAPFAGQKLGNPFYSGEGPVYHMLVIKGYDSTHFITNDVGTRRGENFIYPQETVMAALHDFHDPIESGTPKIIIVK